MSDTVTTTQLDGMFKERYADKIQDLIPDSARIIKDIPFKSGARLGKQFHQPVLVTGEHGVTYAGPDAGAFTLNAGVALQTKDAVVSGYQMVLRSLMDYETAFRAVEQGGQAFDSSTRFLVANMANSLGKRLEISCLYGQSDTGIGSSTASTNDDSTHTTLTIDTATFAAGIWAGSEGASIDVYHGATQLNSNAVCVVTAVDTTARTVQISGNSTDIAAIDAYIYNGGGTAQQVQLYFYGSYGEEQAGIDKILTNTGSLFGIDAGTYNLWAANTYSAGSAALTQAKVSAAVASAVDRGLDEDVTLYVNPKTWGNLNGDQAALRMFDSSYNSGTFTNGSRMIEYFSQNGKISVVAHNLVKEGEAFILPTRRWTRVGATDITFKNPMGGGEFFKETADKAGFELRSYVNQAIFTDSPARSVKITNIVNS